MNYANFMIYILLLATVLGAQPRGITAKFPHARKLNVVGAAPAYLPPPTPKAIPSFLAGSSDWQSRSVALDFYLPAASHVALKFDAATKSLSLLSSRATFPSTVTAAIDRAPEWVRNDLVNVLTHLEAAYQEKWANAILDASDPYVDEIAFCIAHLSPQYLMSEFASVQLLQDNARLIYENDQSLAFVKVVDYGSAATGGDYYSTTRYRKARYIDTTEVEVPREIYYWYIVHPKISDEIPAYIAPDIVESNSSHRNNITTPANGYFWRDFLFRRSDPGYTSIQQWLSSCQIIWNSFPSPPGAPPHAMNQLNRWMATSMKFTSNEERPHQPVRIYRKHIGRCGENGDLRVAAARSVLIPATSVASYSTDHVWNEFWEEKWIHWDDALNAPYMYIDSWNKKFGSVFQWRSDGYFFPVTDRYTRGHTTLRIFALDAADQPIDGAQVILYTPGLDEELWFDTYGTTDSDGQVTFLVGPDRYYYAKMRSDYGEVPPTEGKLYQVLSNGAAGETYSVVLRTASHKPEPVWGEYPAPQFTKKDYFLEIDMTLPNQILRGTDLFDDLDRSAFQFVSAPGGRCNFIMMSATDYQQFLDSKSITGFNPILQTDSSVVAFEFDGDSDLFFVWENTTMTHTLQQVAGEARLLATKDASIPKAAVLQSYPNPFNPSLSEVTLAFELPEKTSAKITIYNLLGQQVITLVDEIKYAGRHAVACDGRDATGTRVPAGVYFTRLSTRFGQSNQKFLILSAKNNPE